MVKGDQISGGFFFCIFCVGFFLCLSANASAQTRVYAATAVTTTPTHTAFPARSYDQNMATSAELTAYSGVLIFGGAYTSDIELQFQNTLIANTTSYVKISTDDPNILSGLVSGTLSSLLGSLLTGNQAFTVDVKNATGTVVLTGDSMIANNFATPQLSVVVDAAGEYLLKITPTQDYKSIKITNKFAALLATGASKKLYVYEAYYNSSVPVCVPDGSYTSYSGAGSGITVGLLNSGSVGVANPQFAIDSDLTNFSAIKMGVISVGSAIEQTIYFDRLSLASDRFAIRLSIPQTIASVLGNISIVAASPTNSNVQTITLANLLTSNLITPQANQIMTLYMTPGAPADRITIRVSSILSVAQSVNLYSVTRTLAAPVITQNPAICQGSIATLILTAEAGVSINWYASSSGGTVLATTVSGQAITTPPLNAMATYYAGVSYGTCTGPLIPVVITVIAKPAAGTIAGEQTVCLNRTPTELSSTAQDTGATITYRWESSLDQVNWTEATTTISPVYQPPVLTQATFYRRITINTVGVVVCASIPSNIIKVTTRNCVVISNPMVRQRLKRGV